MNHLALELDVVEGEGRKVYLPADSGLEEWGTSGFKARFRNILTGFAWEELYPVERNDDLLLTLEEDEEEKASREAQQEALRQMWWEAVQETVREDADLFERVRASMTHLTVPLSPSLPLSVPSSLPPPPPHPPSHPSIFPFHTKSAKLSLKGMHLLLT